MSDAITLERDNQNGGSKGRLQLLLMILVFILPMIGAYFIYKTGIGIPTHTVNYGSLISPPVSLASYAVNNESEELSSEIFVNGKWHLLIPVGNQCTKACQDNLYVTRQVHIRLGEKASRVERVALVGDDISPDLLEQIKRDHPRLQLLVTDSSEFGLGNGEDNYFLVDQLGFAMMRYTSSVAGGDLLKDIKRMLKYSYEK